MGSCYIFNPADAVLQVTLNGIFLSQVAPATPDDQYAPQSIVTPTARHADGRGFLAISEPNRLSIFYPDDPNHQRGPYTAELCFMGRHISVDDDIIIYAGRSPIVGEASVTAMTKRGFVIDTRCATAAKTEPINKGS